MLEFVTSCERLLLRSWCFAVAETMVSKLAGRGSDLPKRETLLLPEGGGGAVWDPHAWLDPEALLDLPELVHTHLFLELHSVQTTASVLER